MWERIDIPVAEQEAWAREFTRKARFLVDQDLDPAMAEGLRGLGYDAKAVGEVGLSGHSDEDVLACAKRDD